MTTGGGLALVLQFVTLLVNFASSQDVLLNVNTKKVAALTSDKFLSLTLDPAVLLNGHVLTSSTERSTNMAKGLAPGYVRLAGPRSNSYTFEHSLFPRTGYEDPELTFSEAHWVLVQDWAQRAGLDVVSSLSAKRIENEDQVSTWDPRNSLDLISFSDHMGYNISWQLGYECQTRCDVAGSDLGKDVARLRNMLGAFPRYSNSIIAGPDVVSLRGKQQQQYIQDYLNAAGNALSVITWHPDFAGIALDSDGVSLQIDTLAADRDLLYKTMGRLVAKRPLWIAESKPEECKEQFLGALVWARRLGSAAKLGVQVIMRQPDAPNILQPTPDYWVSLLHKMLVGREVLDTKLTSGNKTHVHFYCQCTKPSAKYERGAVTIFGLNLTPGKVSVTLKGLKIKALHKYILMPGYDTENRMFAETVLLNNEPLNLVNGKTLPDINPAVTLMGRNMAVKLPSGGIGFWVIPAARVKACMGHDEETGEKNLLKKLARKLEEAEVVDENLGQEAEEDQDLETESAEDIKSLLKSKMKKRKYKPSDETADDEERKFRRMDTKKEFKKFEKFLKRNNNNEEKKTPSSRTKVGLTMFESGANESGEDKVKDNSEDEKGLMRLKSNNAENSAEGIRSKLEEYENKLIQYEARKKMLEERRSNKQTQDVDTQKAIEALALISRVSNHGGTSSSEKQQYEEDARDPKVLELASDIGEEILIDELEKSEKMKRMIDPETMGKLFHLFMSNTQGKEQRSGIDQLRGKRDLQKLLGDDPLNLRKEGLFKKRLRNDEAREKRMERRNRKKEKDDIGLRKELPVPARYDPRTMADSSENNFFGFPQMKPLENFPEGDVFVDEGMSEEEKSGDYDYIKEDDDEEELAVKQQKRNKRRKPNQKKQSSTVVDETWVEEPNSNLYQAPNEFFEKIVPRPVVINDQWKDYGELWEPESVQQKETKEEHKKLENDAVAETVIPGDRLDEREDKKAKETAVKKLINYYDNSEVLRNEQNFERERPRLKAKQRGSKSRTEAPMQTQTMKESSKIKPGAPSEQNDEKFLKIENIYEDSTDLGSMEFMDSKAEDYSEEVSEVDEEMDAEVGAKKRPKRKVRNLDFDLFRQEMIREDAGNLKDCKCRVIRSTGRLKCKNCRRTHRRTRGVEETNPQALEARTDKPATKIIKEEKTSQMSAGDTKMTEIPELVDGEAMLSTPKPETTGGYVEAKKNMEVADLNGATDESTDSSSTTTSSADDVTGSSVSDARDEEAEVYGSTTLPDVKNKQSEYSTDSDIVGTPIDEAVSDPVAELQVNSDSIDDGKVEVVQVSDNADKKDTEVSSLDKEIPPQPNLNVKEETKPVNIQEDINVNAGMDGVHGKRHVFEDSESTSDSKSGSKISLSSDVSVESSAKSELTDAKSKEKATLKLKSGSKAALKSESARNKLALNTEALSALIKENESKKADVIKALESSAKLKSVDNTRYAEYQKKRAEKMANLREKLRERKAKILQQYRQELLEALSKCNDEVERNLKRREIWESFTQQDEFQDFVDKDKLEYLMKNRPVNYDHFEEQNHEVDPEDRRYYPKIDFMQPLRSAREQIVPTIESRRYFYGKKNPQVIHDPVLDESVSDRSSSEDTQPLKNISSNEDSYYAVADSLENPKILHRQQHLDNLQYSPEHRYDFEGKETLDDDIIRSYKPDLEDVESDYVSQRYQARQNLQKNPYELYGLESSNYNSAKPEESYDEGFRPVNIVGSRNSEILHHQNYFRPTTRGPYFGYGKMGYQTRRVPSKSYEDISDVEGNDPEELAGPRRFAFDMGAKKGSEVYYGNEIVEVPFKQSPRILKRQNSGSPCSSGMCDGGNSFGYVPELEESRNYYGDSMEDGDSSSYDFFPTSHRRGVLVRKGRAIEEPVKQSNYICLREDSTEQTDEDENRLFKLVRNDDHYEAVPINELSDAHPPTGRQKKVHRRVAKHSEKVRSKKRKQANDIPGDENAIYYLENGGHPSRFSGKRQHQVEGRKLKNEWQEDLGTKKSSGNREVDYHSIGDEGRQMDAQRRLNPDEYEVLMLIPVNKRKTKRERRDIDDNSINRLESFEDMNKVWEDIVDIKQNENRLQDYVKANEKTVRDFQEAQANLNKYLGKIESMKDPLQVKKFEQTILNLDSPEEQDTSLATKSQDELDRIHLREYLKQEIMKKVHGGTDKPQKTTTTETPLNSTAGLIDVMMPKLETTISDELGKVGNLTESLENFINEFDERFNDTSEAKNNDTPDTVSGREGTISYNIFHTALSNVKKFFDFVAGVSLIFRRH